MSETGKKLTEQQVNYLKGILDLNLSPEEAAKEAGYECPVFETTKMRLIRDGVIINTVEIDVPKVVR